MDGFEPAPTTPACDPDYLDTDNDALLDMVCVDEFVPPDPSSIAPPINPTVITDFSVVNDFIYTHTDPIQRGVVPGTIQPHRMAILRGKVVDEYQAPLPGVLVRVLSHPEFGYTWTRADGVYDLAVNGGGEITVDYQRAGYLRAQRHEVTAWKDWRWFPQTTLIALDAAVTQVTSNGSGGLQVHRANPVTDEAGTRQATVMFQPGTSAQLVLADGSRQPLPNLHFRATEYTVGPDGPARMPAALPGAIAYTYAVELSADEAINANARSVEFDQPVALYFENFLEFPVGSHVPLGAYDFRLGSWLPAPDGRVIQVLGSSAGLAQLDIEGSGTPASPAELAALGITDAERIKLAEIYPVGQTLWRSGISHLTPYDCNYPFGRPGPPDDPYGPPQDAKPPSPPPDKPDLPDPPDVPPDDDPNKPDASDDDDPDPCNSSGSIIDCSNSRLGEVVPVVGTPYALVYQSTRLPGSQSETYRVRVPVTLSTIPTGVKRLEVDIEFAGMRTQEVIDPPAVNLYRDFDWDGRDAYGRPWQGVVKARVSVGYIYDLVYQASPASPNWRSFGTYSGYPIPAAFGGRELAVYQNWNADASTSLGSLVTGSWDATGLGMGGWTLSAHHLFDPTTRTLYTGDGRRRPVGNLGANGIVYIGPYGNNADPHAIGFGQSVWKLGPGGQVYTLYQGSGACGECGDGPYVQRITIQSPDQPFTSKVLQNCPADPADPERCAPDSVPLWQNAVALAVAGDDDIVLKTEFIPYAFRPNEEGDPPPASTAELYHLTPSRSEATRLVDLATLSNYCDQFTSDPETIDQRIYFACSRQTDGMGYIFMAWPDGSVTRLAGGGTSLDADIPAMEAELGNVSRLLPAADGGLYYYEAGRHWIRKIGADGMVRAVAGNGVDGFSEDGSLASQSPITWMGPMVLSRDGTLLFAEHGGIREVAANGQLHTLVGGGDEYFGDDQSSGVAARYNIDPDTLQVAPDGSMVFKSGGRVVAWSGSSFRFGGLDEDFKIPSEDGSEVYVFDSQGRHLRTLNAVTGATKLSFQYNAKGYLVAIIDGDGNTTTIERNTSNAALSVTSPYGLPTELGYQGDGLLKRITAPSGQQWGMSYKPGHVGLLASFTSPRGYASTLDWDLNGRLLRDTNAEGGFKDLVHEKAASWQYDSGLLTTAMDRQSSIGFRTLSNGSVRRWANADDGSSATERIDRSFYRSVEKSTGETIASIYEPDPRFGTLAAYPGATTISPPGLSPQRRTTTRAAVPTTPDADIGQFDLGVQVDINGRKYIQLYDSASRSWGITSPESRTQTINIDAQSRPVKQQVPGLADVDYAYDSRGRLHTITAGSGAEQRQWTFDYDANGYLNHVQDPLNRETLLTRDAAGRTLAQTLPGSRTIQMAWDANNNLTDLTPPGGTAHQFSYNKVDRVTSYAPPSLGATSTTTGYQDNLDSQLDQITDADARVAVVGFVATNSLPQNLSLPGESRSFTFSEGRLTGVSSDTGIGNAIQWAGSLPTGETWTGPMVGSVALQYDSTNSRSNFWVAKRTVTDAAATAFEVDYAYDRDGLPTQVNARKVGMSTASLDLTWSPQHGLLTSTQLGRVADAWSYNLFAEPLNYSATLDGAALYNVSYTRDKLGRITHKEEALQGTTHAFDYTYDDAGRLTNTTRDGVSIGDWTWDANGNRLSTGDGSTTITCQYDVQDRASACGSESYGWNQSGQLTAITDTPSSTTTAFQYDMLGNLQQVTLPDGRSIDYLVDGLDRRIGKKINGTLVQGFLYQDDLRPVAELDGAGAIVSLFVYADRANVPAYLLKDGHVYRIIADQLGSPRIVIDTQSGVIAQRLDYDAWGKVLADTNPGFQPFGFAGGLYDLDTGLVRFGARDYDPQTGRWTAKDPILFSGGDANLYGYVGGDPVSWTDRFGLDREIIFWSPMLHDPGSWLGHVSTSGGQGQNYSFGPRGWDRTYPATSQYIRRQTQDNNRTGIGLVVKLTPDQDMKFDQCMVNNKNEGAGYNKLLNNCTTGAQMCLINSGVPLAPSITPEGFKESLFDTGFVADVNWYPSGP